MEQQHLLQEQIDSEIRNRIRADETALASDEANVAQVEPQVVGHLGDVLRQDTYRRIAYTVLLPFLPFAPLLTLKWLLGEEAWIRLCTNPVFVVAATLLIGIGVPLALLKPSRKARQAAHRLSTPEDVRVIGGLVETLCFGHDRQVGAPVREALIRLLPRLKAS